MYMGFLVLLLHYTAAGISLGRNFKLYNSKKVLDMLGLVVMFFSQLEVCSAELDIAE